MVAKAASQNANSNGPKRPRLARKRVTAVLILLLIASPTRQLPRRAAGKQTLRAQDQDHDHDGIDHESTDVRNVDDDSAYLGVVPTVVFAHYVCDAKQDRGKERPGDARRAAYRDDDEEVDHVFERKDGIEAENLRAQGAAEAGEPRADRKRDGEHRPHIDAEPARLALIVHGGAQPAAEAGGHQHELQRHGQQSAYRDNEQTIAADAHPEHIELALQRRRNLHELLGGAHDVIDGRYRHENEADREQHLVEMALGVDMNVKRAFQHRADRRGREKREYEPGMQ